MTGSYVVRAVLTAVVVAAAALCAAAPAGAVFPGANGRLVVMGSAYDPPNTTPLDWPWGNMNEIRFSADDSQVTGVVNLSQNGSSIWTADVNDDNQQQLTSPGGSAQDMDPAWSPDGKTIAFIRETEGTCGSQSCPNWALLTVPAAGGQTETVIPPAADDIETVDWSPNPDSTDVVVVMASATASDSEVDLVDTSTDAITTLASEQNGAQYTGARFAPDGNSVVTAEPSYSNYGHATVSVIPTGSGQGLSFDVVAGGLGATYPTFTPDGQAVTYSGCDSSGNNCGIWNAILPASDAPPGTQPTFQEVLAIGTDPVFLEWEPLVDAPVITGGPTGTVNTNDATFEFSIPDKEDGKYQCQLDEGGWNDCSSPQSYSGLADGQHTFQVRFVPTDDEPGPPAKQVWTIDTTPPTATITSAPSGQTTSNDATIYFTSSEPDGATYQCSVDGGDWYDCDSPQVLTGLGDGGHTFAVKAIDAAGNEQQDPTEVSWEVVEPESSGGGPTSGGSGGSAGGGEELPPETPASDCSGGRYTKVAAGSVIAIGRAGSCFVRKPQADGSVDWIVTGTFSLNGVDLSNSAPMILYQTPSKIRVDLPSGTQMGFGAFSWTIPAVNLDVGTAASAANFALKGIGKLLKIAGLKVTVDPKFQLSTAKGGSATVSLDLQLPPLFQGVDGEEESSSVKPATMAFHFEFSTSNESGPRFAYKQTVKNASLFGGLVQVQNLSLGLDTGPPLSFDGEASMKFEGVNGTFSIKVGLSGEGHGPFPQVTELAIEASDLNKPIAEGVFLQRFGGGFVACGTGDQSGAELSANAGVSIGPEIDLPVFKGSPVGIDGTVTLHLCDPKNISVSGVGSVLGFPIAGAIARYTWSEGKIELDGDVTVKLGPFDAGVAITNTFFDMHSDTWQVEGTGHAGISFFGKALTGDADVVLSSNGIAGCLGPKGRQYGFGTHAINQTPTPLTGSCDLGPYRASGARDAAANQFTIPAHERIGLVALHGQGTLPEGSLQGPGGESIDLPPDGGAVQTAQAVVLPDAQSDTTYVVLYSPRAGTWTVAPQAGAGVAALQVADGVPPVKVSARVTGRRNERLLKWSLRRIAGQRVTFVEQGGGVSHVLLSTERAHGSFRFAPAAGIAPARQIIAFVSENGLPRDRLVIAAFRAPSLHAVHGLQLRRGVVRWSREPGAVEYSVMLSSHGLTDSFLTRRSSVRVPHAMAARKLRVWISALGADDVPGPVRMSMVSARRR